MPDDDPTDESDQHADPEHINRPEVPGDKKAAADATSSTGGRRGSPFGIKGVNHYPIR